MEMCTFCQEAINTHHIWIDKPIHVSLEFVVMGKAFAISSSGGCQAEETSTTPEMVQF